MSSPTRAPAILIEAPKLISEELRHLIETGLQDTAAAFLEPHESIRVLGRRGNKAAYLRIRLGNDKRAMQFEVFTRDVKGKDLEGALGVVVDFFAGVLEEYFEEDRAAYLPLDFTACPYEKGYVFARQEMRNFTAEEAADTLLAKPISAKS